MVVCFCVVCFLGWFKEQCVGSSAVRYCVLDFLYIVVLLGSTSSHLSLALTVIGHYCMLISANSSTEPLSPSNSENGDNDNSHPIPPAVNSAKSTHSNSLGRGETDHPCHPVDTGQISFAKATKFSVGRVDYPPNSIPELRAHSLLSPPISIPTNVIEDHQIKACPNLPIQSKVEIVVEKFGGGCNEAAVSVNHPSSSASEPVITTDKWIRVSPKKRFRSMALLPQDISSPLVPPAIIDENIVLAHLTDGINHEVPENKDPLNAMEDDMPQDPNDALFEDSQDLLMDEEDMVDTFLNLDPIQALEMSFESSKKRKEMGFFWDCDRVILSFRLDFLPFPVKPVLLPAAMISGAAGLWSTWNLGLQSLAFSVFVGFGFGSALFFYKIYVMASEMETRPPFQGFCIERRIMAWIALCY
ncbi:hypothetical protein Cgig2_008432 [Carnegiea gigantea]|uniref:Uncharacterized protein n=1 Tax=Carnegiea gigantea TaxID=171969 RepID=A0A9Q1JSR3_9CARY|nr:hypothetical protein Cgig2_008432 [Carnegiea gigantea]